MPDETPTVAPAPAARLRWLASWLESGDCGHAGDGDVAPLRALADALEALTRDDVRELRAAAADTRDAERQGERWGLSGDPAWAERLAEKLAALLPPEG